MTHPMITARGVTKRYELGALQVKTNSLREALVNSARGAIGRLRGGEHGSAGQSFLALEDVSFDVAHGEVMGVIGRNGAGKSTLLKVLSRITEPTAGRIELRGHAASLLEVGTGFHPELTGRENIYLNGTILGMRKRDIDRKFDEIVEFAEVGRFVDTPVKRYSSGMYVRLAFGVAAHLDPEILIVDEVLAVGDAEFQKKCLGKMSDVASEGRTVLFVSHNMAAVRAICSTGLLLSHGKVVERGPVSAVLSTYARQSASSLGDVLTFEPSESKPQFTRLELEQATVEFGDTLGIRGRIQAPRDATVSVEIEIHDERGTPIAYMATAPVDTTTFPMRAGVEHEFRLGVGPLPLATGRYSVYFWLIKFGSENFHVPSSPLTFEVVHSDPGGSGFEFRQSYGRGAITVPMSAEFE